MKLRQMLLNLIVNGIDATASVEEPVRSLTIRAGHDRTEGEAGILISVEDVGLGKARESREALHAFFGVTVSGCCRHALAWRESCFWWASCRSRTTVSVTSWRAVSCR